MKNGVKPGKVNPLVRRVWFNMVKTPTGWMRVGNAFGSKEAAEDMLDLIVRGYYPGRETKAEPLDLNYVDGRLDEQTARILDEKFNLDAA
jgi:hypothetical protein